MWRPLLKVRFGKGRNIFSPTTTLGYAWLAAVGAIMAAGLILGALSGKPLMALGLVIPGIFLGDAWAWFAASEAEREVFRAEIAVLVERGFRPPDRPVGTSWGWATATLWLVLLVAAGVALGLTRHPAFVVLAMAFLALLSATLLDRFRARRR